ncbi:SMC domain-containing protein [Pseudomonas tremae]|uniref:SMC domain-containing protein n=1 Tax=Pseudomonas tremae TaxID=200454 RepID=A0AA40TT00_9PSED|nr:MULTISPECIES: AAA family ATPase [Pseudomonas syringae group]KPY92258.1 SMC domain-containing protein [Pseudomonas tremae]RMO03189.1 SMC domain-containing protein [Pseudomonas coronafaciens pv. zizaniae]
MKQLKSITLSNIRRFSADTTIELSQGATILLAPNGTGKTAFFEAIELGLTGKILRLGDNLLPIIRDTQSTARVRLDFGDVQAAVEVNSIGDVERTGDLSPLFPDTNPDDIPFLLRLTHLLDQREGEWLVQADPKVAGSQLARLPIGKDGTQVSSALGSIRRALTDKLKQAKSSLEVLETEFNEWQSLALERDLAASQSQGALRSRENIAESISDIARQAKSYDQLPAGLLVPPLGQDGLETVHDALEQLVQTKLDRLRDQITALTEVDGLIGRFVSEQARSEQLGSDLVVAKQVLAQRVQDRAAVATRHEQFQQELVTAQDERDAIVQQLNRHMNEINAKETVEQRKQALETADKTLATAETLASTLRTEHEGNQQLGVQHDLINRQRAALLQIDADLLAARELVVRWEQAIEHVAQVAGAISDQEVKEDRLQEQLRTAVSSRTAAETEELAARSQHETLTSAADSIRQAVASIAAHLPADRGDCPLCGEEHGAEILHKRVAKALEAIDPNVVDAERRVKKSADALRECTDAVALAEAELKACKGTIIELEHQQAGLLADIDDLKSSVLLGGDTVPLAKESIRLREDANASAKLQLDEKQSNLAPALEAQVIDRAKDAYDSAARALETARQERSEASSRLGQATAALAAITSDAPPAQTLEELSLAQNQNANQIVDLSAKVAAEKLSLDRHQAQLSDMTSSVSGLETQLSDTQARLATVRAAWRQLSLAGDPNAEVASGHEAQLQSSAAELDRHSETLQTIKIEIGAWSKLEQTRLTQGLLDRRRGELSEDAFTADLRQRVEHRQLEHKRLSQLSDAMDTLNQHLSTEIANVQKHVLAVVPRWQALLKRVVREQRFTGTNLDFRSLYRKERAEVSVQVNGEQFPVPVIASEAQLTDLQLTFLLSMALDHQWSSWRGLLLDDPTQHHDLVHAASVFDVLRDYIVDHGFQVVIATHDALQARYFMRKLQNDGIEARIWSLAPTPDGVTALETPWPAANHFTVIDQPNPSSENE